MRERTWVTISSMQTAESAQLSDLRGKLRYLLSERLTFVEHPYLTDLICAVVVPTPREVIHNTLYTSNGGGYLRVTYISPIVIMTVQAITNKVPAINSDLRTQGRSLYRARTRHATSTARQG